MLTKRYLPLCLLVAATASPACADLDPFEGVDEVDRAAELEEAAAPTVRVVPLPAGILPRQVSPAPDGSIVFISSSAVGRATFPATVSLLRLEAALQDVVVAPTADIWVTRQGENGLVHLSPTGTLLRTFPLWPGYGGSHVVVSSLGTVWVAMNGNKDLARIKNGALANVMLPGSPQDISEGINGYVFVSLSPANVLQVRDDGVINGTFPTAVVPAASTRGAAGGELWFLGKYGEGVGHKVLTEVTMTYTPVAGQGGAPVLRGNYLWFSEPDLGRLGRLRVSTGAYVSIALPSGTRPLGVAKDTANRLWVADATNARLLVVTP